MEAIDTKDSEYKHYVYSEIAALPVHEFNDTMKNIFAGTRKGKKIVAEIIGGIKKELQEEAYNDSSGGDDTFSLDDFSNLNPFDM
jgi:hypothetical protein